MAGNRPSVASHYHHHHHHHWDEIDSDSSTSHLSFKRWHRRMQTEHEIRVKSGKQYFGLWKWCHYLCYPCRWFDSIVYEKKICKCCFMFKTLKTLGTILLVGSFCYMFLYSILGKQVLPGGCIFFLFVMFLAAYVLGYCLLYAGLPPMFGHMLIGIFFGNIPPKYFLAYDKHELEPIVSTFENICLVIALIRAGLLLDLSRIKNRFQIILRISLFPLICECGLVWIFSHLLLHLPWEWGALQGSVLCIVSLASITSVMEMNRAEGYGEDIHLSTVLIAASAFDVVFGIFLVATSFSYIYPSEKLKHKTFWHLIGFTMQQVGVGLLVGITSGLLAAFFPDKRNVEAAALRILVIGTGGIGIANFLHAFNMEGAGVLAVVTMCLVAGNMWEEIGWHQSSNPVQYFYSCAYYFAQPVALSLVGFSMNFTDTNSKQIGLSCAVIFIGLIGKETVCYLSTLGNAYPTTCKEKIFICIAWFSKGTFQAILSYSVENVAVHNKQMYSKETFEKKLTYAKTIKITTVLAILLTTPMAYFILSKLSPILLKKKISDPEDPDFSSEEAEADESKKQLQKMFFRHSSHKRAREHSEHSETVSQIEN